MAFIYFVPLLTLLLSGCARAPSFVVAGSFFPAWLIFMFAGILLTLLIRVIFIKVGLDDALRFRVLIYSCLALGLCYAGLWLLFLP
ncbi:YtcA family lipoprotein [Oceanisphaera pacifica]|uniref:Uncharacterized protein YtcA n=1 Tax=Oceanisphaera pacifica TaxID=2818389 RepID=A0ABS3NI58_9GAMM|nr:YtcA family lipoprotein [Oceanisphaera pacifica]MBO1519916.1 hypothetical protein [Oceanisphaera pacifica]